MCGEKMMKAGSNCAMLGSPPRMRGKALAYLTPCTECGITPAYAGKSTPINESSFTKRDHPRVCGEKPADYVGYKLAEGSPPRMRGKVRMERSVKSGSGITPAYAGKRSPQRR